MLDDIILSFAILPTEIHDCQQIAFTVGELDADHIENTLNRYYIEKKGIIKAYTLPNGYGLYKLDMDNPNVKFHMQFVDAYCK